MQWHGAAALVAYEARSTRAAFLMDAQDAVLVQAAEEGDSAGLARELHHFIGRGLHQRVGEADLAVELDDARAQSVAMVRHGLDEAGLFELCEVAVGAGARELQRLGGVLRRPGRARGGEEGQDLQDAVGARHGAFSPRETRDGARVSRVYHRRSP